MADIDTFLEGGDGGVSERAAVEQLLDNAEQNYEKGASKRDAKPEAAQESTPAPEPEPEPEPAADPQGDTPNFRKLRETVEAAKKERNDYKGQAARLEGELAAHKAELEALRKTAVVSPPPPAAQVEQRREPQQIPDMHEDPAGYHAYIQHDIWNRSLNMSEVILRQAVGDDADVDAKVAAFKKMAESNPALKQELARQPHPYKYVYDYAKRAMALDEIGDPEAYRAKLAADIRAELEAEYAGTPVQQPQRQAPRVNIPQSLGTARSAQSRSTPILNVAESFNDILGRR